jgi:hypothetical protein
LKPVLRLTRSKKYNIDEIIRVAPAEVLNYAIAVKELKACSRKRFFRKIFGGMMIKHKGKILMMLSFKSSFIFL